MTRSRDSAARRQRRREEPPFPFGRTAKTSAIAGLVGGSASLAAAFAPLAFGREEPIVSLIFGSVILIGLALASLAGGAIGPSLEHHQRTGRYLIPAKGGNLETRYFAILWLVLGVFGGLGMSLAGLGVWGLVRLWGAALGW